MWNRQVLFNEIGGEMSAVNIEMLLEPLAGDKPVGVDMEYDLEFTDLALKAKGEPDRVEIIKDPENSGRDIERITPGKECDARTVLESALALFKRTKDLRVAMYVVYGATRTEGLPGLAVGAELVAGLLDRYWDDVYPELDEEVEYGPDMRINALNAFCDPALLLRAVKGAAFAEARAIGKFTLRDLDVASGDATPQDGQLAATPELLRAVCAEMDQDVLAERLAACRAAIAQLAAIVANFEQHTSASPDFTILIKILKRAIAIYEGSGAVGEESVAADAEQDADGQDAAESNGGGRTASVGGKLASRADAKRMLEQVCTYLDKAEPAHPSPLLIRRAIRLLDMNFMDIMRELTPESVSEIEKLGGIRNEAE